jgi:hypothetical protein
MATYTVRDDGGGTEELLAETRAEAIAEAAEWVRDIESTIWVTAYVTEHTVDEDGDDCSEDISSRSVSIDPVEPSCDPVEPSCDPGEEHDWRSPLSLLGGCEENPGVWGNGGGVIIAEVCAHCGCKRMTDTWAQRPDTGEQGLESVSYEECWASLDELVEAGLRDAEPDPDADSEDDRACDAAMDRSQP